MKWLIEIREGFAIAGDALRSHGMRSILSTLGIVIGVATVTLMAAAIDGMNRSFRTTIAQMGSDVLYVMKVDPFSPEPWWKRRNRRDLTMNDLHRLQRQSQFAETVVPEAFVQLPVRHRSKSAQGVGVIGTSQDDLRVRGFRLASGRFMSAAEVDGGRPVCVLGSDVAENFFPSGNALGQRIQVGTLAYEIVGVLEPLDKFLGLGTDNHLFIPITQFLSYINPRPELTLLVKVKELERLADAKEEVRSIMRRLRHVEPGDPDDFGIMQQDAILKMFQRVSASIATVGFCITGLALLVGGIGIMNVMFISVAERTREIGIRKAIGAKRRAILTQFLLESALICATGGVIAIALAFPVILLMQQFLPAKLSPAIAALAMAVALVTGVISGFLPAWRAARLNPVDALRSE